MSSITPNCKITIHMVSSLDGLIAKPDNSVSWFETSDHYDKGVELSPQAMTDFLKTIDCYIMGARTYEHALELSRSYGWAYGDTPTIVLTHKDLPVERQNVELYTGSLHQLISEKLKTNYKNAWVVGGAALTKDFLQQGLADDIRMTVLPIILGDGIPFFDHIGQEQALHLKDVTAHKNGMVELHYEIKK